MAEVQQFFAMDGHGLYVWLSYGISWLVILALVWRVRSASREFLQHARARIQRHNVESEVESDVKSGAQLGTQQTAQEES